MQTTRNEIETVQALYAAFGARDEAGLRELLAPEVEWIQCAGFPGGGHRHGPGEVVRDVLGALHAEWEDWRVEVDETIGAPGRVIVIGRYAGTHGVTRRSMEAALVHVFDIEDGRVTRFRQVTDTVPIAAAASA